MAGNEVANRCVALLPALIGRPFADRVAQLPWRPGNSIAFCAWSAACATKPVLLVIRPTLTTVSARAGAAKASAAAMAIPTGQRRIAIISLPVESAFLLAYRQHR
jgi:hypothetical protein